MKIRIFFRSFLSLNAWHLSQLLSKLASRLTSRSSRFVYISSGLLSLSKRYLSSFFSNYIDNWSFFYYHLGVEFEEWGREDGAWSAGQRFHFTTDGSTFVFIRRAGFTFYIGIHWPANFVAAFTQKYGATFAWELDGSVSGSPPVFFQLTWLFIKNVFWLRLPTPW